MTTHDGEHGGSQINLKSFFGRIRPSSRSRSSSSSRHEDKKSSPSISRASSFTTLGNSLSRYGKKVDVLGSGISSKVELYYKKQEDEYYAVKVFRGKESYETKDEYKNRCFMEYDIAKELNHPNIAKTYNFISGVSTNELVLEYAPYPLLRVIQSARPYEEELFCFFRQMNMELLSLLISELLFIMELKRKKPACGVVGTEALVSPEAMSHLEYDGEASDIWALGIVLYSMLNLDFPWKAARESDPDFKAFKQDRTVLEDKFPTEVWESVVSKVLQVEPSNRITVEEIIEQLDKSVDSACPHSKCPPKRHSRTLKVCQNRFKFHHSQG
ncbi:unnamed protein product [Wickerhamomyces anomalus]